MQKCYVLVADSTRARVFDYEAASKQLNELYDIIDPLGRLPDAKLSSDRPGRLQGGGAGHAFESKHANKEYEHDEFARRVCQRLEADRISHKFDSLIMVAPPKFLGELRNHLSDSCEKLVTKSMHSNLSRSTPGEILQHLKDSK